VHQAILNDFDLSGYRYNPADNPWADRRAAGTASGGES
jgi:hypothetical protein